MSEELQQVDESVLTSLLELRHERDALRQRLSRMQEAASEVSEKVLGRVRSDYQARIAALDDKAAPLKDSARGTYGRLQPALDRARAECEALRLDHEEVELRHQLGEFDADEYRGRADRASENLSAAQERAAAISGIVERFRSVLDSAGELDPVSTSQVDLPSSPVPPAASATPAAEPPHEEDGTLMLPPEPPAAPEPPPLPDASPEPPVWAPMAAWSSSNAPERSAEEPWRAAAAAFGEPQPSLPPSVRAAKSSIMDELAQESHPAEALAPEEPTSGLAVQPAPAPRARLEALDGDLEPQPHFLEPLTFVGRTPENQIRIYKPAVSRRHAQITETDAGWLLRDLSSENGTYVNGQRVTERLLADGDRVQFGTSRFVLRLAT